MAVDTTNKRYSAMHIGLPWRTSLPIPDGTIDQGDRQQVAWLYRGVLASSGAVIVTGPFCIEAMDAYTAGAVIAEGYSAGAVKAASYQAGAVIVQGDC